MELTAVIERKLPPEPWEEGEKIPWNDPGFSARMLQEHLSQDHDAASRRSQVIERHVAWIHDRLVYSPGPYPGPGLRAGAVHQPAGPPGPHLHRDRLFAGLHRLRKEDRPAG